MHPHIQAQISAAQQEAKKTAWACYTSADPNIEPELAVTGRPEGAAPTGVPLNKQGGPQASS